MIKSVICAIVKDEQRFIKEWVEHYLNIGFDKLYIYEDYGSKTHYNEISEYIEDNKVELINLDSNHVIPHFKKGTIVQGSLYSYFLEKCRKEHLADWIGFFDVDEFVFFEDGWNLEKLEEEFKDVGGILLSWKIYGANGYINRPKGSIVKCYTSHLPEGSLLDNDSQWNVKSLVNVAHSKDKRHIHVFDNCVYTNHEAFKLGHPLVFDKAWINHYYTKSWEDYLVRIFSRGNMANNFRCLDKFFKCNPELMPKKEEMIMAQRHRHAASTMWISRDLKIISGGNERRLNELRLKYIQNK